MKAKLILAFISLVVSLNAFSQWGIKGGINTGYAVGESGIGNKLHIGGFLDATYDVKIYRNLYFQPAAGFYLHSTGSFSEDGYMRVFGAELPLNLSFRPSIAEDIGLFLDFGIIGRLSLAGAASDKSYFEDNNMFNTLKRVDIAYNLGLGIQIEKKYMIGLAYQSQQFNKYAYYHGLQSYNITFGYKF